MKGEEGGGSERVAIELRADQGGGRRGRFHRLGRDGVEHDPGAGERARRIRLDDCCDAEDGEIERVAQAQLASPAPPGRQPYQGGVGAPSRDHRAMADDVILLTITSMPLILAVLGKGSTAH